MKLILALVQGLTVDGNGVKVGSTQCASYTQCASNDTKVDSTQCASSFFIFIVREVKIVFKISITAVGPLSSAKV